jgi:hypothetical protein
MRPFAVASSFHTNSGLPQSNVGGRESPFPPICRQILVGLGGCRLKTALVRVCAMAMKHLIHRLSRATRGPWATSQWTQQASEITPGLGRGPRRQPERHRRCARPPAVRIANSSLFGRTRFATVALRIDNVCVTCHVVSKRQRPPGYSRQMRNPMCDNRTQLSPSKYVQVMTKKDWLKSNFHILVES